MNELKLVGQNSELVVSIDASSWHALDEEIFFKNGRLLRKAFGTEFVKGLFKRPSDGILQRINAVEFYMYCETVWTDLQRDQDILPFSYSYEFDREKGITGSAGQSGFQVRGRQASIWCKPKGYCTLRLMECSLSGSGRDVEIIDLRNRKGVETDDRGFLKVKRRKMNVDWYKEMPRILEFCDRNKTGMIETHLPS